MQCQTCGIDNGAKHQGVVDCIQAYRNYIGQLQQQILDLKSQLPPGEAALVASIGREIRARLWIEGKATIESIDQLMRFLELLKDTYPPERQLTEVAPDRDLEAGGD